MDASVFAFVPSVQLGNNLLYRPGHSAEIALPAALNVITASKRDHVAIPVGAFNAGWRLCSLDGYYFVR
jgi:hypothetical protein